MEKNFWGNKKVLVTGGAGFVGSHLVEALMDKGAIVKVCDSLENGHLENLAKVKDKVEFINIDLSNLDNCLKIASGQEIILHLAAKVGGIEFNRRHPATMFRDNIIVNSNVFEAARQNQVERMLVISSACIYPRDSRIPMLESEGFNGSPEETNEGYGWAKRMVEVQARVYNQEFGMRIAIARPFNTFGPRDHFEPEKSHVIPALIKRIFDGEDPLKVWGSGEQSRSFIYVEDVVRGLLALAEKYPSCDPINIGTDEEVKIKDLVKLILEISNKKVKVFFDTSRPSGQPRRNCDNSKAKEKIGFVAKVSLREGLERTIKWYVEEGQSRYK